MTGIVAQLNDVLRGLWQGRWVGLVVAWLASLAGAAYLFLTPDRYEATARVYVDTQSILKPLMMGLTVQPNVEQEVALLSRTLISRPNLQKLVRTADLDLGVRSPEGRERLIDELMRSLYIRSTGRDNLYTIGFTDPDPHQAQRVVQSLLSIFVDSGLSSKSNDTGQAKRFIQEQIKAYEQRLNDADNRVKQFKLRNMDLAAPSGSDFFGTLAALAEKLRDARVELEEAQRSSEALKQQIADEQARADSASAAQGDGIEVATPDLDARISALNRSIDEMLLRYTESHPDVVNSRHVLLELQAQRDAERKRLAAEMEKRRRADPSVGGNALYSQLKLAQAEAEAQTARLRARVAELEKRHAHLVARARSVPEREAEFAQLTRDYTVQKQNYEQLVARRETATMSGEMEAASGVADFRIIDPPRVSSTPASPNRKMLLPLVLLASLVAGLGAAYFVSWVHPTFHNSRGLTRVRGRPVLGAVSLIATKAILARRRRGVLWFVGGLGGLTATYGAALAAVFLRSLLPF